MFIISIVYNICVEDQVGITRLGDVGCRDCNIWVYVAVACAHMHVRSWAHALNGNDWLSCRHRFCELRGNRTPISGLECRACNDATKYRRRFIVILPEGSFEGFET